MKRKSFALLLFCALALVGNVYAVQAGNVSTKPTQSPVAIDCKNCHACDVPTAKDLCLKQCPTLTMTHTKSSHALAEAPDSLLIDELVETYEAVHFDHKRHAGMAEMNDSCGVCHHYSPPGHIPPCKECHKGNSDQQNLRQPGLKGAYHRQCLSCHREWSHDTKCIVCHLPSKNGLVKGNGDDPTDIVGRSHPVITTPAKKVYDTPYKDGPVVTFQHKEHIDLFGFRCVDCHRQENCGYCHDIERTAASKKTQEQVHAVCNDCHKTDACAKCHDTKERPGFSHNQTGWPLNPYHATLDCWACHPTGKKISTLNRMCANCHAGWNQENFKHAVTGLKLDETHAQMDCTDCHAGRKYDADPVCKDCHDDGRTAKSAPPGTKMQRRGN